MKYRRTDSVAGRAVAAFVFVALLFPVAAAGHPAVVIVDKVWKHLGGEAAYEKCRYVEFTWTSEADGNVKSERKHTWDRYAGDYVLEFVDSKTSDEYKIYFNVDSKKGVALRNGSAVDAAENAELLERAYGLFINDTYWLLVPTKLQDPGAKIRFVGHAGQPEADSSEGEFVILHLYFDKKVGLTPGDQYWFHVTHEGEIVKWRYVLEDGHEGEWDWADEKDCGMGVVLPMKRVSSDGDRAIVFRDVKFSHERDRSVFESAEHR